VTPAFQLQPSLFAFVAFERVLQYRVLYLFLFMDEVIYLTLTTNWVFPFCTSKNKIARHPKLRLRVSVFKLQNPMLTANLTIPVLGA